MNRQLALAIHLNDEANLADFCWNNNPLLHQEITQTLNGHGERFLYLWGSRGCGKTHLLQACCQSHLQQTSIYLPLAMLKEWGPEILRDLDQQSLIAIDDIDVIAGNNHWETALFHLYNRIRDNHQSILLISGRNPPQGLAIKLRDLQSRLSWGLVLQIRELADDDKINTLKLHARRRGLELSSAVCQFLLNRSSRNMHDLQLLLNRLDEASLIAQRKITIPFIKEILNI
ncbi:DnaA regulatory inactivator Hda [Legionella londiniensis]|uniref:DnaA-like family protein n=1 Tax=Legionella londiniensis TaxID=45068 RepID=A0A0W0VJ25_9GAMM|nr:DnaA regulatory inactivator Hda [Legionella londiniensis]KTD19737.1 DnaA-like family protein [Legionella londiniensis]STX92352.1 DnaA-like family protein [Legionella londiniensis]